MTEKAGIRIENPTIKRDETLPLGYGVVLGIACFLLLVGGYLIGSELLHLPLPSFLEEGIHALASSFKA